MHSLDLRPRPPAVEPTCLAAGLMCLLPVDLAPRLERVMARWGQEHATLMVIDRRRRERREACERRSQPWPSEEDWDRGQLELRRIRNQGGRRVAERRATLVPMTAPADLPRRAILERDRLTFVERIDLGAEHREDIDTARMVIEIQRGEEGLFANLYERYFDRVYSYLRLALHDRHEAEDAAQHVFIQVMEALPRYELRDVPFRAWLFRVVRNYALNHLEKHGRVAVEDPVELDRLREVEIDQMEPQLLEWLSDSDLVILVSRLPMAQRQVMMLRYMMDLSWTQIADVLGRSPAAVRQLQARALAQLRVRLAAKRSSGSPPARMPMVRRRRPLPVLHARRFALLAA